MKFVILIEESGYELRYWDEVNEEIRDSIVTCWDKNEFYDKLVEMGFHMSKRVLERVFFLIEDGKPFVVLSSVNNLNHLDNLHYDEFVIEE